MEGAQEFGYQLMTTVAAEKQRYHIKNENNSENREQNFAVEDLLDFSNNDDDIDHIHDDYAVNDFVEDNRRHRHHPVDDFVDNADVDVGTMTTAATTATGGNSTDSSSITVVDRCSAENGVVLEDPKFDNDLCVPYDDLAELEWLSNFVEESFSSEDLQKLQFISGQSSGQKSSSQTRPASLSDNNHIITAADYSNNGSSPTTPTQATSHSNPIIFNPELTVPAKARSKRSRAAPCKWASRLLLVSPTAPPPDPADVLLPTPNLTGTPRPSIKSGPKKRGSGAGGSDILGSSGEGRKCLHCATDKTPQWRTGPLGPKTLCNACGVRYKSGRLVPEYRPAASPTFVLTKHSNSHRKVMELRRQKEMMRQECQNQQAVMEQQQFGNYGGGGGGVVFDVTNGDDYLIHQHVGPDYRQLI